MTSNSINIEISDQIVKVCRTARKGKSLVLSDSFMFQAPENCISDGVIANPEILSAGLRKQLDSHGLKGARSVCFSVSSTKVAVREVKLPPLSGKQLGEAIRTNAEEYFPIDLKAYHITYKKLDYVSGPNPFVRILVMAAPLSMLEGYFRLADKSGLRVRSIDTAGNSQYQLLRHVSGKGVTIYADVGASSSTVSFLLEEKLLLQRTFACGADELISHYLAADGKGPEGYFEALEETDVTSPDFRADSALSLDDINNDLDHLVGGILRSLDYFNSNQWENTASRIVLMGQNRHIVGLRELVSASTGLETLYLDEIREFASLTGGAKEAPSYVSGLGCQIAPLDFMPKNFVRSSGRRSSEGNAATLRPGILICALLVFCGLLSAGLSILGYRSDALVLDSTKKQISQLESAEKVYETYISYQKGEKALEAVSADADSPNSGLVSFFGELEKKMPSSILLLSAACSNQTVSMNITVSTVNEAAAAISALREFDSLSNVQISDITRSKNEVGEMVVTFTAVCTYGENPYHNGINPYASFLSPSPSPSSSPSPPSTPQAGSPASPETSGTKGAAK